jgi:SNF family Na+-dependent transporter
VDATKSAALRSEAFFIMILLALIGRLCLSTPNIDYFCTFVKFFNFFGYPVIILPFQLSRTWEMEKSQQRQNSKKIAKTEIFHITLSTKAIYLEAD